MTISAAVLEIARRYDINVIISPTPLNHFESPSGDVSVFMGCGLSLPSRTVYLTEDVDIEMQLHEVAHVITHPTGCQLGFVRENFLLMQVERELARKNLTRVEFDRVVRWQRETTVQDDEELFEDYRPYWRDGDLWLDGYKRAMSVGLLDDQGRPTYQKPTWPNNDAVSWYYEWMKAHDVIYTYLTKEELRIG